MKLVALIGAGLIAAGTLAAAPADAQRYGYRGYEGGYGGYGGGYRHYRGDRWHRGGARWNRGYGYRGDYGYRGGYGYRGRRVVCRVHRGYYGPVRTCFRR